MNKFSLIFFKQTGFEFDPAITLSYIFSCFLFIRYFHIIVYTFYKIHLHLSVTLIFLKIFLIGLHIFMKKYNKLK